MYRIWWHDEGGQRLKLDAVRLVERHVDLRTRYKGFTARDALSAWSMRPACCVRGLAQRVLLVTSRGPMMMGNGAALGVASSGVLTLGLHL
jgi:hypothetical protein